MSYEDEQGPSHAASAFEAVANFVKSTRRIDLTRPRTYHLLFNLNNKVRVFIVRPLNGLNKRIEQFADLILVDPEPRQFLKDRYGLNSYVQCHEQQEVLDYIEEQRLIWKEENSPRNHDDHD